MEEIIGVKAGAVNLFSIVNDTSNKVTLVMDARLMNDFEFIGWHPMQNDHTTAIPKDSIKKLIAATNHEALVLDFTKLDQQPEETKEPVKVEEVP
jgi:hypothetical protein